MNKIRKLFGVFGEYTYNYINYTYLHLKKGQIPKPLNLSNPKTFSEKIIYLKINYRHPNAQKYVNKLAVRNYVSENVGEKYLIPIIKVYEKTSDINFKELPNQFVLKLNHGSGMNIICKDKDNLDESEAMNKLKEWYNQDYFEAGGEYQYGGIEPKVFAEKYMATDEESLKDYKVFCFNGEPKFIQVDVGRYTNHKRAFYDLDWNRLPFTILHPKYDGEIKKPEKLKEMIEVARTLAKDFIHIRVDLYNIDEEIFFGELTFHHGGGFEPVMPPKYNRVIGDYLRLPDEISN